MNSEQINCVNLWLDKQAIGFIFPIHYSEQINCVNLWLGKQAIGFIFPIHYSEQINCVNLWLDKQAIGFIFPIHYLKPPFKSKGGFLCLDNSKFFPLVSFKSNKKNYPSIKNICTVTF